MFATLKNLPKTSNNDFSQLSHRSFRFEISVSYHQTDQSLM